MSDDATDTPASAPVGSPSVLTRLTRAQVFARDPEDVTEEDLAFILAELRKINERNRKARKDDAAIVEATAKMKKANATTRKKKAGPVIADILDAKL